MKPPRHMKPQPGQMVWLWSEERGCPIPVTYLGFVGRSHTWTKWREGEKFWKVCGHVEWFDNPVNCAWHGFQSACIAVAFVPDAALDARTETAFRAACEYVRRFSDQFKKPAEKVWAEKITPSPHLPANPPKTA